MEKHMNMKKKIFKKNKKNLNIIIIIKLVMNKIHAKRKKNNLKVIQKQVNQSELQIWSLKNLSFQ